MAKEGRGRRRRVADPRGGGRAPRGRHPRRRGRLQGGGRRTDFIIIDLVDLRAKSNAQEVELAHQYITYNVYGAEIDLRNEFRSAWVNTDRKKDVCSDPSSPGRPPASP